MKKFGLKFIKFSLGFLFVLFYGCQQELPDIFNSQTGTTLDSVSVIRQMTVKKISALDPVDFAFSFQYDTANRKIKVYLNDTLTANPFDLLAVVYEFNNGGYLVKSEAIDDNGVLKTDYIIMRNAANQIQHIIDYDAEELTPGSFRNDTIYYSYSTQGGQTVVRDSVRIPSAGYYGSTTTTYNTSNKPLQIVRTNGVSFGYTKTFSYNAQGMVSSITTETDTTDFVYDNHQLDTDWEKLPELFLGKDHYILSTEPYANRLSWHFLTYLIEDEFESIYQPLFTKPLHTMSIRGTGLFSTIYKTQTVNFTNTYITGNKPSSIMLQPIGGDPMYFTFKY